MALRATSPPAPEKKSARVGERIVFRAKIENTAATDETLALHVEDLKEGALGKPVAYAFTFDPPTIAIGPKTRKVVEFAWIAGLPEGKPAFTFRGKLVLRRADGEPAGFAPLDLYVSS